MALQSATFSGPQNQGSQIATNSGTINNYFSARVGKSLAPPRSRRTNIEGAGHPQSPRKPCSNVPFRRDDDFVDRGDLLAQVGQRCSRPAGRAALVGFGGFGKSQLAIEYAHRVHERSAETWVFWVYASDSARLEASFSDIAETVGLTAQSETIVDTLHLVRRWLCNEGNGPWLMIVDNADSDITMETKEEKTKLSLSALLPQAKQGAILVTSRNADVARTLIGRERDLISVEKMSEEEAVDLLGKKLGDAGGEGMPELVRALDYIPLAIVQAAAYIVRLWGRMSVPEYLDKLKLAEEQVQLLYRTASDMRRDEGASNSALKTWQLSFDYLQEKQPSAASLLSFMCIFNSQGIPEFMIRHYTDRYREERADERDDTLTGYCEDGHFEEDIAVLRNFSLISMTPLKNEFNMHGLVQLATRVWLRSTGTERKWYESFVQAMAEEFPNGQYTNWPRCQALFPHVLAVIEREEVQDRKTEGWALVLNNSGWYLWRQGLFAQAAEMAREALEIRTEVFDAGDSRRLLSSALLASVLIDLGQYRDAESMNRQTLARYEKVLGAEHPDTLTSMSNLALTLGRQGKYEEAESMNRQTLARREKVLGAEHPDTLTSLYCLAHVLANRHCYDESTILYERACVGYSSALGDDHPTTRSCRRNYRQMLGSNGQDHLSTSSGYVT